MGHWSLTRYDYEVQEPLTEQDENGGVTGYDYDPLGRVTGVARPTDPKGKVWNPTCLRRRDDSTSIAILSWLPTTLRTARTASASTSTGAGRILQQRMQAEGSKVRVPREAGLNALQQVKFVRGGRFSQGVRVRNRRRGTPAHAEPNLRCARPAD